MKIMQEKDRGDFVVQIMVEINKAIRHGENISIDIESVKNPDGDVTGYIADIK